MIEVQMRENNHIGVEWVDVAGLKLRCEELVGVEIDREELRDEFEQLARCREVGVHSAVEQHVALRVTNKPRRHGQGDGCVGTLGLEPVLGGTE